MVPSYVTCAAGPGSVWQQLRLEVEQRVLMRCDLHLDFVRSVWQPMKTPAEVTKQDQQHVLLISRLTTSEFSG